MKKLNKIFTVLTVIATFFILNTLVGCPTDTEEKASSKKDSKMTKIDNDFKKNPTYSIDVTGDCKDISAITINALGSEFTLEATDDTSTTKFVLDENTPEWFITIINYLKDKKLFTFQDFDPTGIMTKLTKGLKDYPNVSKFFVTMITKIFEYYTKDIPEGVFTDDEIKKLLTANMVLDNYTFGKDIDLTSDVANFQVILTLDKKKYNIIVKPATLEQNNIGIFESQKGTTLPLWVSNLLPIINSINEDVNSSSKISIIYEAFPKVFDFTSQITIIAQIINPLSQDDIMTLNTAETYSSQLATVIDKVSIEYKENILSISLAPLANITVTYDVTIDVIAPIPNIQLTPKNVPTGFEWTTDVFTLYANAYLIKNLPTVAIVFKEDAEKKLNYIHTFYPNTEKVAAKIIEKMIQKK